MGLTGRVPRQDVVDPRSTARQQAKAVELAEGRDFDVPPPRKKWRTRQKEDYRTLWNSDLSRALRATDVPVVLRLFDLRDDYDRAQEAYRNEPMIEGSQGQDVLSPMGRHALSLEASLAKLEDRLGLSPAARARLGLAQAQEQMSWKQLMASLASPEPARELPEGSAEVVSVEREGADEDWSSGFVEE